MKSWESFVVTHGWKARSRDLAAVLGEPEESVRRVQETGACKRFSSRKDFAELFALKHGRPPRDDEWPVPLLLGRAYEWLAPEHSLLASLVGQVGTREIAKVLTERLRKVTGDRKAERTVLAVQLHMGRLGLQSYDVVGGLLVSVAGKEIGSVAEVLCAIDTGALKTKTKKVGRLRVIPYKAWEDWKAGRARPPQDHVPLAPLAKRLGIRSTSKLAEFAKSGRIPTATLVLSYGFGIVRGGSGAWYLHKDVAEKLVRDRRAGLPMPWHGKPDIQNMKVSYRRWQKKRHPDSCTTCCEIWGEQGTPKGWEDFQRRYPSLTFGAKRHITLAWAPGLTFQQLTKYARVPIATVRLAVKNGALVASRHGGRNYVTKTHAARWRSGGCRTGESRLSWMTLEQASRKYDISMRELRERIATGDLTTRQIAGKPCVPYVQLRHVRESLGYTEAQAAKRLGISVAEWRHMVKGVDWRQGERYSEKTVRAVLERFRKRHGFTVPEAARQLKRSRSWVQARIDDGTVKPSKTAWSERVYLNTRMMARLKSFVEPPKPVAELGDDWLQLDAAVTVAGVSGSTLNNWTNQGGLTRKHDGRCWRYKLDPLKARARRYWRNPRLRRAVAPAWFQAESTVASSNVARRGDRRNLRGAGRGLHSAHTRYTSAGAQA